MEFRRATTLDEALDVLDRGGEQVRVLAGGTDVMIQLPRGELEMGTLLHVEPIKELTSITSEDEIFIGSLATHRKIATSDVLANTHESIRTASGLVGGWQTQIAGTIGGNICNASPASDLAPPLLVHGAEVVLSSKQRGRRTLALQDFMLGRRQIAREPDELLVGFRLPAAQKNSEDIYIKVGRRSATEVAIVGLALRLSLAKDETVSDVRVAVCAAGPVPSRALATEDFLSGKRLSKKTLKVAGATLLSEYSPIDDIRASAEYRRSVLPRILESALTHCEAVITGERRK